MIKAEGKKHPTFAEVKRTALQAIDRVLAHWLPGGKRVDGGKEYTAPNPTRADKRAGSLKVNLAKGTWRDFATSDKGGDLIDLVHYLDGVSDVDACNKLAEFLHVTAGAASTHRPAASPRPRNGCRCSRCRMKPCVRCRRSTASTASPPRSGCTRMPRGGRGYASMSWPRDPMRQWCSARARSTPAQLASCCPATSLPAGRTAPTLGRKPTSPR